MMLLCFRRHSSNTLKQELVETFVQCRTLEQSWCETETKEVGLFKHEVTFLERIISEDGYRVNPKATSAVTD